MYQTYQITVFHAGEVVNIFQVEKQDLENVERVLRQYSEGHTYEVYPIQ